MYKEDAVPSKSAPAAALSLPLPSLPSPAKCGFSQASELVPNILTLILLCQLPPRSLLCEPCPASFQQTLLNSFCRQGRSLDQALRGKDKPYEDPILKELLLGSWCLGKEPSLFYYCISFFICGDGTTHLMRLKVNRMYKIPGPSEHPGCGGSIS